MSNTSDPARHRAPRKVLTVPMSFLLVSLAFAFLHAAAHGRVVSHAAVPPSAANTAQIRARYGRLPLAFEANRGQTDARVKFLARGSGYTLFLTPNEAVLALQQRTGASAAGKAARSRPSRSPRGREAVLRLRLVGASKKPRVLGMEKLPGKANYQLGNDPRRWHTNARTYARVVYRDIYPSVDLVYRGNQGRLEYDFVVRPSGDPRRIVLAFEGARRLALDRGRLLLELGGGELRLAEPRLYQAIDGTRRQVTGSYLFRGGKRVGFRVGAYDPRRPLVIDPTLVYSTYLGGGSLDRGFGIAVDAAGSAYITGATESSNFPTMTAFQGSPAGSDDAFVSKLNPTGTALAYSTYLGGSNTDAGLGIAVDAGGDAYVTGQTNSSDFPTTLGAFQGSSPSGADAFVTKLNPTGSALLYSTFLGGLSSDGGFAIALDGVGNAYATGATDSSDFPTSLGAFDTTYNGGGDAFVTKLLPVASTASCEVTITNGGWIVADNGDRANFGGNAKVSADGSSVQGQEEYQDQGPARPLDLHSTALLAATCSSDLKSATIYGIATINGSGTHTFRIDVTDMGSSGTNDSYGIVIPDIGYASGQHQLQGGNVTIHT